MQGSEESRSTWQIAFGLEDSCLVGERVDVVRCDIENLIKLSQRFGETTKLHIGKRVLGKHCNVAGVEPLGFVEVTLAPLPRLACVRHMPATQESGCYWARADVLAQNNAPRCRNPLSRHNCNSP